MKTIGLLGGMSWESSLNYYKIINEQVKQKLGALHSAKVILNSIDFYHIEQLQKDSKWQEAGDFLGKEALKLQNAGCDFLLICTNTMHKVYDQIASHINIPILHIADATAKILLQKNAKKIALLGTMYTMKEDFYKKRLQDFGIEVIIPTEEEITILNKIIFEELCLGIINKTSKNIYLNIIQNLQKHSIDGVILGCTEISILINQEDIDTPLYDTTFIHSQQAVQFAFDEMQL